VNNFPSSGEISRKDLLAANLAKMSNVAPDDYRDIAPKSWVVPAAFSAFERHCAAARKQVAPGVKPPVYIVKPVNSAMGRGIRLVRDSAHLSATLGKNESAIVQEYLDKPLLIDGYKFDLRIYVLVLSFDPLRVFLYDDGLVRISTKKYAPPATGNLDNLFMHLTNYSINKDSETFDASDSEGEGSKRSMQWLFSWLYKQGKNAATVWDSISDVVLKTLIAGLPQNRHATSLIPNHSDFSKTHPADASKCFAVYGFDVMLDQDLNAYVIEVNRSPSYSAASPLDKEIKQGVIKHAILLANPSMNKKKATQATSRERSRFRLMAKDGIGGGHRSTASSSSDDRCASAETEVPDAVEAARCRLEDSQCGRYHRIFPRESCSHPWAAHQMATSEVAKNEAAAIKYSHLIRLAQGVFVGVDVQGRAQAAATSAKRTHRISIQIPAKLLQDDPDRPYGSKLPTLSSSPRKSAPVAPSEAEVRGSTTRPSRSSRAGARRSTTSRQMPRVLVQDPREAVRCTTEALGRTTIACGGKGGIEIKPDVQETIVATDYWVRSRRGMSMMYLRHLSPTARPRFLDQLYGAILGIVGKLVSAQAHGRVHQLLRAVRKAVHWNRGAGLWNLVDQSTLDWDHIGPMLPLGDVSECDMALCIEAVRLCQRALVALFVSDGGALPTGPASAAQR